MRNNSESRRASGSGMLSSAPALAVCVFVSACAASTSEGTAGGSTRSPAPIAVRTELVRVGPMRETVEYVAAVRSRHELKLSPRTGGTLIAQLVDEGEVVEAGAAVARLETPELRARLRSVRAELAQARSKRAQACRVADRDAELMASGALARARADATRATCESATHAATAARARLGELRITLGSASVESAVSGRALRWLAEPGELLRPGQAPLLLGSGERELEVEVTARDLARGIGVGTSAIIEASGGTARRALVIRVAPVALGPGRHVAVRLDLPARLASLPNGAAVDLRFVLAEEPQATPVPRRALTAVEGDRATLFTVVDGAARLVPVSLGVSEGERVSVHPALRPGTEIATTNLGMLADGTQVYSPPPSETPRSCSSPPWTARW